jgi:hypothetical protein
MLLEGDEAYRYHFNETDELSASQKSYAADQLKLFKAWYANWNQAADPALRVA